MSRHGTAVERLLRRTTIAGDECWEWQGPLYEGYGRIRVEGHLELVHRVSYEFFKGPIPQGMDVDHTCFNRRCWNPAHLEAVTKGINNSRAARRDQTKCRAGLHPWVPENLVRVPNNSSGRLTCKACREATKNRYLERRKRERAQR